jgi:hypothetical protein
LVDTAIPHRPEPRSRTASATLERLISPYTVPEFISRYWEQTYLHVSREQNPLLGGYLTELISVDDIDYFLATICGAGPQRWDSIRLSQGGTPISPAEYQFNRQAGFANFDVNRILSLYRNGATLIANSVQQTLVPVATLCRDLADFFGVRVLANVYITPPSGQGFPAHPDNHDVILLQVLGAKHWKLYGSPEPLSVRADEADVRSGPGRAYDERCLQAGEALYIPRGLVHEGTASSSTSLHVTVGIHPYTWAELLTDVVSELQREDVEFRRSVAPQLAAVGDGEALGKTIAMLSARLNDTSRLARVAAQRAAGARGAGRMPAPGRFRRLVDPPSVTLTTMLQVAPDEEIILHLDEDAVVVASREKVITLPAFVGPQVEALFGGEPTCATALPPGLDDEGKLVLVQRLVREGLLEPEDATCGGPVMDDSETGKDLAPLQDQLQQRQVSRHCYEAGSAGAGSDPQL